MEEINKEQDKKQKKKKLLILLFLLVLAIGGVSGWLIYQNPQKPPQIISGLPKDETEKMTGETLKKYANKKVDESNVTITVYSTIRINNDGKTGKWYVQNAPVNKMGQQAELVEKATGKVIYKSGLIKPGYQVSSLKLEEALSKGKYDGVVNLYFYDLKSEKKIGQTKVDVKINVQ